MEQLHFTTRVLGPTATKKLVDKRVTQTIRSASSSIVKAIKGGNVKVGDQMQVTLDNKPIGLAELVIMDETYWAYMKIHDAWRGGFNDLSELEAALRRAGYRFMDIDNYKLFRINFSWL